MALIMRLEQGLDSAACGELRYQLLHRTASAVIERDRFGANLAVMLVHSWAPDDEGWDDYEAFVARLGGTPREDTISSTHVPGLCVGWVTGNRRWLTA